MSQIGTKVFASLVGLVLLFYLLPRVTATMIVNIAQIVYTRALVSANLTPATYPHWAVSGLDRTLIGLARELVDVALKFDAPSNAQWSQGRFDLALGDSKGAARALASLGLDMQRNPIVYQDAFLAFSLADLPDALIALYEQNGDVPNYPKIWDVTVDSAYRDRSEAASDTVALAYIARARGSGGDRSTYEKAWALRPGDLYVGYHLMHQSIVDGDLQAANRNREALSLFPLRAITPTDDRLLDYAIEVIPNLLSEGLWDNEKALDVVAFLVWRARNDAAAKHLLEQLTKRFVSNADWPFYLAEFYRSRGNLTHAEAIYHQVVTIDPLYARAYLRLGVIYELLGTKTTSGQELKKAAWYFERYHEAAPQDLLGLKKLAGVYKELDPVMAARYKDEWLKKVADQVPSAGVEQSLKNGWVFLGYQGDERSLVRGEPTSLLLYWQDPIGRVAGDDEEGWYSLGGNRWVQTIEDVTNLVFDGGFELGLDGVSPGGFPDDIYRYNNRYNNRRADPSTRRLIISNRGGTRTSVAALANTNTYTRTSLISTYVPVDPTGLYLQGGWIRSQEGNGYMGRRWGGRDLDEFSFSYLVDRIRTDVWKHYSGIAQPPPNAGEAQVWLLNFESTGWVYFDDIIFVKIGMPGWRP